MVDRIHEFKRTALTVFPLSNLLQKPQGSGGIGAQAHELLGKPLGLVPLSSLGVKDDHRLQDVGIGRGQLIGAAQCRLGLGAPAEMLQG